MAATFVFNASAWSQVELKNLPVGNRIDWYQAHLQSEKYHIQLVSSQNYGNGKSRNLDMKSYDLSSADHRAALSLEIKALLDIYKIQKDEDSKNESQASKDFPIAKDVKTALKYLEDMNQQLSEAFVTGKVNPQAVENIYEVSQSINLNYQDIVFPKIQLGKLFAVIFGGLYNSRLGENPISMIDPAVNQEPKDNTFWQKPENVAARDTGLVSFDRHDIPDYKNMVFEYTKPKTGYGTRAGFRVEHNGQEYKIRLGEEVRISPFETRLLYALGFNSLAIDYTSELKVKYNKRLFREFNSRKTIPLEFYAGKTKLIQYKYNGFIDPFQYILRAVMQDGSILSGEELRKNLILSSKKKAVSSDEYYNEELESKIKEIVFEKASIEKIDDDQYSVGPWSWNDQRHIERRDIRGYGLLAAWLGQYDARVENTRLMLIKDKKDKVIMRHVVSDVGSGLGKANPLFSISVDDVEHFREDVLTTSRKNDGQMISKKYQTYITNKAFEATNKDDAKWMYGYMKQLTEKQIKQALLVSGFNRTEANEVYRKLMLRMENIRQVLYN